MQSGGAIKRLSDALFLYPDGHITSSLIVPGAEDGTGRVDDAISDRDAV
jgi:hypothetical protein